VAQPSNGPPSDHLRSEGLPQSAYDELIRYSREYLKAANGSHAALEPVDHAAEIAYLVLRISKGDVRLRLGTLAHRLNVEPRTLGERFRRLYGATPKDCQIRLRIEWACSTIRTFPDRKIGSIAAESGYSDIADFNHVFRKYVGISPRQYQEECQRAADQAELTDQVL
jgi:transcriptional regulator GlxA family with amidase domain